MSEQLITLAILTYEKAQIVRTILEGEGIDVSIVNVNQIQPIVSAGVRVRIRETDLPRALHIIEDLNLSTLNESSPLDSQHSARSKKGKETILVPVDFSDYSYRACLWAIRIAADLGKEILLLHSAVHTFTTPFLVGTSSMALLPTPNLTERLNAEKQMKSLIERLRKEMDRDTDPLPFVRINSTVEIGEPEDRIVSVANTLRPYLIVMGSRGISNRAYEMVGSVTADVVDRSRVPVITVSHDTPLNGLHEVKRIGFATSFAQRDLLYFDLMMQIIEHYDIEVHIFNISTSDSDWDSIKLKGVHDYFSHQYPNTRIQWHELESGDRVTSIAKLVERQQIQMVALPLARKSMWIRFFNPSLAQKMLFSTSLPLLVFNTK